MFSISSIRAQARQTIADTDGTYLLALLPALCVLINQLISMRTNSFDSYYVIAGNPDAATSQLAQSSLFPLILNILSSFLILSVSLTLYRVIRKKQQGTSIKDAFAVFNHPQFGSIILTALTKGILLFLWSIPIIIGVVLLLVATLVAVFYGMMYGYASSEAAEMLTGWILGGLVLTIAGYALYFPQHYAYSLTEMILFERLDKNEYQGVFATIKESRRLMKGYKAKRFVLDLSFIGWTFLTALTFGILGVYTIPYYYSASIHFYDAVLKDRQLKSEYGM